MRHLLPQIAALPGTEAELLEAEGGNITEQLEGLDAHEDDMLKVLCLQHCTHAASVKPACRTARHGARAAGGRRRQHHRAARGLRCA